MVIVDTSVWVNAWRAGDPRLDGWMAADLVLQHPFVTAEIGMGSFPSAEVRADLVQFLNDFEQLPVIDPRSFHNLVGAYQLFGTGIGFADAHLLLACLGNSQSRLATLDKRLAQHARRLNVEVFD